METAVKVILIIIKNKFRFNTFSVEFAKRVGTMLCNLVVWRLADFHVSGASSGDGLSITMG